MLKYIALSLATACILLAPGIGQTGTESQPSRFSPVVVAQRSFVNQTGSIQQITLFTPSSDGNFEISAYLSSGSCTYSGAAFDTLLSWTDDSTDWRNQEIALLSCNSSGSPKYNYGQIFIHAKADTPVSLIVQAGDVTDSYSLYLTVVGK
jgi:hypothetical protein